MWLAAVALLMASSMFPGCRAAWNSEKVPTSLLLSPGNSPHVQNAGEKPAEEARVGIASGQLRRPDSIARAQSPDEEFSSTHLLTPQSQLDYAPEAVEEAFDDLGGLLAVDARGSQDPPESSFTERESAWQVLADDYRRFYSPGGMGDLVIGLGVGGLMAHTNIDSFINDDLYQETIRSAGTDEFLEVFHEPKILGEGKYMLPVYATLALTRDWIEPLPGGAEIGEWGQRSWRTVLTGGPAVLVLQRVLGGSRPGESDSGSHWTPFEDNNAVSGHAFMGAVPFLSAAAMTDRPGVKLLCYAGSVLPALSRINDEGHYPSQAFLGWYLALLASRAVDRAPSFSDRWKLLPWIGPDRAGLQVEWKF